MAQGATVATAATGTGTVWTPVFTTAGKLVLRSSKGDGLHRPDSAPAVTSWSTGIGNEWTLELAACGKKVVLRSSNMDGLHRPDSAPAITTWGTGIGNEWTLDSGKVKLKSVKGDYLNRTDAVQGVNAAATGTGTVWSLEMLPNQ
ncbi:MAG TPA: hypothetical protein VGB96_09640 [Archangium sp.]|jgi:hypothetical protein